MGYKLHLPSDMQQKQDEQRRKQEIREDRAAIAWVVVGIVGLIAVAAGSAYNYMYLPEWCFFLSRFAWGVLAVICTLLLLVIVIAIVLIFLGE